MDQNPLKVAIVGLGGISGAWLSALKSFPDVEIVGVADLNPERSREVCRKHELGSVVVATTVEELLRTVRPDIVCDCTVPSAHHDVTMAALEAGCHVIGEKPMADTMERARDLCRAALRLDRVYAVMQNRRALADTVRLRDTIGSRQIGELTTLNVDFFLGPHFGGFREDMDHVLLLDMAIHTFDMARFISGKEPLSVYCRSWNPRGSWYRHGASAVAVFTMTDGVVFTYRGSWCAEGMQTSWEGAWRATGTGGTVIWDRDVLRGEAVGGTEGFMRKLGEITVPPALDAPRGHAGIIRHTLDCIRQGSRPQTFCIDNIRSLAMVHAAIESAESGREVPVDWQIDHNPAAALHTTSKERQEA